VTLVPAERRDWAEAAWAEAAVVPGGWRRWSWLAGGARLTAREAARTGRLWYPLAFAAAAAGTAWSAWSGPPGNPAVLLNRVDVIVMAVILAALPWGVALVCGPVAEGRRALRAAGYAAVLALVLVKTAVRRVADAPPNNLGGAAGAWAGEAVFLAVMAGYAALILVSTSRRPVAAPRALAFGAGIGVIGYALGPLGFPLRFAGPWPARLYDAALVTGVLLAPCAPVAAGWRAATGPGRSRVRRGAQAGLCAGAAAALVVATLSTATIALLPYDAGLRGWAVRHIGHWAPAAGHWGPVVGPGTRVGYVAGNSAFAAGYLLVLVLGPLLGAAAGACAASAKTAFAGTSGYAAPEPLTAASRERGGDGGSDGHVP
jgi:hypothetical protein